MILLFVVATELISLLQYRILRTRYGGHQQTTMALIAHSPMRVAAYNIRNGRAGGLLCALRAMSNMSIDFGVLLETKVTDGIYSRSACGYRVLATNAVSRHQGGIALFYKESAQYQLESIRRWGPNVVSFVVTSGNRKFGITGKYPPATRSGYRVQSMYSPASSSG